MDIRSRPWHRAGVAIAGLAVLLFLGALVTHRDRAFAFTPRWSALFAGWALLVVTLLLDALVRGQGEVPVDKTVQAATTTADMTRKHAARVASTARARSGSVADDRAAREAGALAVAAAAEHAAALVRARRAGLKSLMIGTDGRASTSKIQAVMWTYAVLFALLYMVVLGRSLFRTGSTPEMHGYLNAFSVFIGADFRPEYVALLGLPIAGAVTAKGITSGKVTNQELVKQPTTARPGLRSALAETVSNDAGEADLLDFQYFAFNLVGLLYFFIAFFTTSAANPSQGLPTVPATLLSLAGVSTTAYLVKKQLESGVAPIVRSVTPMRIVLGVDDKLRITGYGFLAEGLKANSAFNQVLLDGRPLPTTVDDWTATDVIAPLPASTSKEQLEAAGWTENRKARLVVRDDRGNSSPPVTVELLLRDGNGATGEGASPGARPATAAVVAPQPGSRLEKDKPKPDPSAPDATASDAAATSGPADDLAAADNGTSEQALK